MTTSITYNTDLALYSFSQFQFGERREEECLPADLQVGEAYPFLKMGHRNYEIGGLVTLLEMEPDEVLFRMRAEVEIVESFYVIEDDQSLTRGTYRVTQLITD